MRRYSRRAAASSRGGTKQDFWLSFSDLMSVLVLVFILVLFYILYKYFLINAAYQQKFDEMLVLEAALSDKEAELDTAQANLATREDELATAQAELTTAQDELARQQLMINLAQEALEDSEASLASKQEELDTALALLDEREEEIAAKQAQIDEQQAQLEALVGVRSRIIRLLSATLAENGINATVDASNGSIMLESNMLFGFSDDKLSGEGKDYIDEFLPLYLSVLFSDENADYISEVIIEGHTDNVGTYNDNLRLSQNRAYAVAEYVLSDSNKSLSSSQKARLKEVLTVNGRSYSDLIYDANGNVDADASRRVVFKFRLTDEQMITQMQQILNGNDRTE